MSNQLPPAGGPHQQQPPTGPAPGDPYHQQSDFGFPQHPYGQPGPGVPDGGSNKLPMIIGGVVLGLVVAVVAVLLVINSSKINFAGKPAGSDGGDGRSPGQSSSQAPAPDQGAAVVKGYLTALAAGDAEKAIGYLSEPPDDGTMMTDKVLRVSAKKFPITDITTASWKSADKVKATYRIDGQKVSSDFTLAAGTNKIEDGSTELDLVDASNGLPLTINGVKVKDPTSIPLFAPGGYLIGTSQKYTQLTGDTELMITKPGESPDPSLNASLTSAGQTAFREAVQAALADCIASNKRNPGCALDTGKTATGGLKIVEGSVSRTLSAEARSKLRTMKASLDPTTPSQATAHLGKPKVTGSATFSGNGRTWHTGFRGGPSSYVHDPTVDMTSSDLKVYWSVN